MSFDLFKDLLPSLNLKHSHLLDENLDSEKYYNAYIVNKAYSYDIETIFYSNEINMLHFADNKLQYDFYFYGLEKKKRFNKWLKPEAVNNLDVIQEYYQCSNKKSKEILSVLTDEQLEQIKRRIYKGTTS